jgi:hypothetical protein
VKKEYRTYVTAENKEFSHCRSFVGRTDGKQHRNLNEIFVKNVQCPERDMDIKIQAGEDQDGR